MCFKDICQRVISGCIRPFLGLNIDLFIFNKSIKRGYLPRISFKVQNMGFLSRLKSCIVKDIFDIFLRTKTWTHRHIFQELQLRFLGTFLKDLDVDYCGVPDFKGILFFG